MSTRSLAIIVGTVVLVTSPGQGLADFIGISYTGNVYQIDQTSGRATFIGASGYSQTNSLVGVGDTYLTIDGARQLVQIDPQTGQGTFIRKIIFPDEDITSVTAMSFSPVRGLLISAMRASANNTDSSFRVDLNTGIAFYLSHSHLTRAVAYTPDDKLYAWQANMGLEERNPRKAEYLRTITDLPFDVVQSYGIQSMASTPEGVLYGGGAKGALKNNLNNFLLPCLLECR